MKDETNPSELGSDAPRNLRNGLLLAFGTFTVLPVPAPQRVDRGVARRAMLLAPVTALVPGLASAAVLTVGVIAKAPALLMATFAIAAVGWLSRGLHLDGLADTADGLAASYDRDRALAVMRTGDIGPAGAATLLLVTLAQVGAVAALVDRQGLRGVALAGLAVVMSRSVLVIACGTWVPTARDDGLGVAVAQSVPPLLAAAALLVFGAFCAVTTGGLTSTGGLTDTRVTPITGLLAGPIALAGGILATGLLLRRCRRRLGGVTGDVLGACIEVALTMMLTILTLATQ